jgi:hypothetical protein
MHVEIGAEAALFPEKEYISGIFVAMERTEKPLSGTLVENKERILPHSYQFHVRLVLNLTLVPSWV